MNLVLNHLRMRQQTPLEEFGAFRAVKGLSVP